MQRFWSRPAPGELLGTIESFDLQGGSKRLILKHTDHRLSSARASWGSANRATSPATSANAVELDVSTGAPQTIASNTGIPNPAYTL